MANDRAGSLADNASVDVSFVMPCLDEALSLPNCIAAIDGAVIELADRFGLTAEIVVADNGSTDGSQALARNLGARVIDVAEKGYGAALRGGFAAAHGRYLIMGDADASYDFREAVPMIVALTEGADLCMGSRFKGGVKKGAMPWKNRYIGNPLLTGTLNLLFHIHVSDAHCGLRALTSDCFQRLGLTGAGMEFASEMVIKAALKGEKIVERPATLSPDLRDRPPHLRPWRDGWRHLRYLFMLSPLWLFAIPAMAGATAGGVILAIATSYAVLRPGVPIFFGNHWAVLASALVGVSHIAAILGLASHLYGLRAGYRRPRPWVESLSRWVTLETMIAFGVLSILVGLTVLAFVAFNWTSHHFNPRESVVPSVVGTLFLTLGAQNILGGFMLSIVSGNEAKFLSR